MTYRDLRINGKLAGRYDPERDILELKLRGGVKACFDLAQLKLDARSVREEQKREGRK